MIHSFPDPCWSGSLRVVVEQTQLQEQLEAVMQRATALKEMAARAEAQAQQAAQAAGGQVPEEERERIRWVSAVGRLVHLSILLDVVGLSAWLTNTTTKPPTAHAHSQGRGAGGVAVRDGAGRGGGARVRQQGGAAPGGHRAAGEAAAGAR